MTLTAVATVTTAARPQSILEFVLDLDRYREVDRKIMRVGKITGPDAEGRGSVGMWARMGWLPPAPDRQVFVLDRWERITFTGAARQPARLVFDFVGVVECTPVGDETRVVHRYEFRFRGPYRLVERPLAGWLQRQIEDEVRLLAARFSN